VTAGSHKNCNYRPGASFWTLSYGPTVRLIRS